MQVFQAVLGKGSASPTVTTSMRFDRGIYDVYKGTGLKSVLVISIRVVIWENWPLCAYDTPEVAKVPASSSVGSLLFG